VVFEHRAVQEVPRRLHAESCYVYEGETFNLHPRNNHPVDYYIFFTYLARTGFDWGIIAVQVVLFYIQDKDDTKKR
jgi:hypothetical protein